MKDLALLKFEDIDGDELINIRAKTLNTSKIIKTGSIFLTSSAKEIIDKYSVQEKEPKNYIFSIIDKSMSEIEKRKKIKNFTRYINQHLKILAVSLELPKRVSFSWARHSFATTAIDKGASTEFVKDMLKHSNIKTTERYIAGLPIDTKRKWMKTIVDL